MFMFSLEALNSVKHKYFICDKSGKGYERSCGILSVADGTMRSIGHLFAASVVNGGPAPCFLSPWIYEYMVNGLSGALQAKPMLSNSSKLKKIFDQVNYS